MSASPKVLKVAQDAFVARLANGSTGFNAQLGAVAASYSITPYAIDFSDGSKTFFKGRIDLASLEGSNIMSEGTIMTLSANQAIVTNETKFLTFSGRIGLTLDVWLSVKSQSPNWYDYAAATFDAILQSVNDQDLGDWSGGIYNYDLNYQAGPVRSGEGSRSWWGQQLTFQFTCEVHAS